MAKQFHSDLIFDPPKESWNLHPELLAQLQDWSNKLHALQRKMAIATSDTATVVQRIGGGGGGSPLSGSGNLQVRTVDGSVIVNPTTDLRFDTGDGFVVLNLGGGSARVDLDITGQSYYRSGQVAITVAGTTVNFSKLLNNPLVWATSCVDSGGTQVGANISSITTTGFIATPIVNATLTWRAQPKELPRDGVAIIETTPTDVILPLGYDDDQWSIHIRECLSLATWSSVGVEITAIADGVFAASAVERAILFYQTTMYQ